MLLSSRTLAEQFTSPCPRNTCRRQHHWYKVGRVRSCQSRCVNWPVLWADCPSWSCVRVSRRESARVCERARPPRVPYNRTPTHHASSVLHRPHAPSSSRRYRIIYDYKYTWHFYFKGTMLIDIHGGAEKNGATISLQNILGFHDRIAWKLVNFCNIICWTPSENTATVVYSHCTNRFKHHTVAMFSLGGATARWNF